MLSLISVLVMEIPSSSSTYTTQYTGGEGLNPALNKGEPNTPPPYASVANGECLTRPSNSNSTASGLAECPCDGK